MLLFSDWDETISAHDTLSLIAPQPEELSPGATTFEDLSKAYSNDAQVHNSQHGPAHDLEGQMRFLESLDEVELKSQSRIEQSGLFRGFDLQAMEQRAASQVEFRDGWTEVAKWLQEQSKKVQMHVISVGWSARFIAKALASEKGGSYTPAGICANEVELDASSGKGTGRLTKSRDCTEAGRSGIRVAQDKQREMHRLIRSLDPEAKQVVVYCGDSNTDLGALLEADVGLIFGDASSLLATLERIGLGHVVVQGEKWAAAGGQVGKRRIQEKKKVLIHVRDWTRAQSILEKLLDEEQVRAAR